MRWLLTYKSFTIPWVYSNACSLNVCSMNEGKITFYSHMTKGVFTPTVISAIVNHFLNNCLDWMTVVWMTFSDIGNWRYSLPSFSRHSCTVVQFVLYAPKFLFNLNSTILKYFSQPLQQSSKIFSNLKKKVIFLIR